MEERSRWLYRSTFRSLKKGVVEWKMVIFLSSPQMVVASSSFSTQIPLICPLLYKPTTDLKPSDNRQIPTHSRTLKMASDEIVEIHEWSYPSRNRQDSNSSRSATSEYESSPYGRDNYLIYEEFHSPKAKRLRRLAFRQQSRIIDLKDWQEGLEGRIACLEHEQDELYDQISGLTVSNICVTLSHDQFK